MTLLWFHVKPWGTLCKARLRQERGRWQRTPSSEATFHGVPLCTSFFLPLSGPLKIERSLNAAHCLSDMNIKHTLALSCLKLSVPESISTLPHLPCAAPPATAWPGRNGTERGLTAGPTGLFLLGPPHTPEHTLAYPLPTCNRG